MRQPLLLLLLLSLLLAAVAAVLVMFTLLIVVVFVFRLGHAVLHRGRHRHGAEDIFPQSLSGCG